jgi:heterodisulfide reductase subunit A2
LVFFNNKKGNFPNTVLFKEDRTMANDVIGSVLVLGGGIAGMQSALDLANAGYYVYLVEKSPSIGGVMSQLDKTFPTNDCAM